MDRYDIAVIGGGINGAGIARDAAGRGFRTLLVEKDDLASATSSASTKLIHGGLRYLEYYEFRLVGESLAEREVVLRIAPHIVRPLQFVLPHEPHLRPAWMIRAGLFLYDHLGRRVTLPRSRGVRLEGTPLGAGLKPSFRKGFAYYDAKVDDARLVVLNARSAADKGATIRVRTECIGASRQDDVWRLRLADALDGRKSTAEARVLLNVAGPWVRRVIDETVRLPTPGAIRLVKGSHIVVPRLYEGEHAYILQNPDRRVIFMLPYEGLTCIGTTDVPVDSPEDAAITREEIEYLCTAVSRYAVRAVSPSMVVNTWSGIRPLYDDGKSDPSAVTRDYHFELDDAGPPLLSIYGGKLTTYRKLGEAALARLERWLPAKSSWTADEPLPGGDFDDSTFAELAAAYGGRYPRLPAGLVDQLFHRHGTCTAEVLGDAQKEADLGRSFGGGLYEREVRYLIEREWARTAEDVLWRRTKCGIHMDERERRVLAEWIGSA